MTVLVLDTATLYYRAFFALPETLTAPDGFPNNAVRGTLGMLTRLVNRHRTSNVIACWDADWRPQWRVDLVPEYKAHRLADEIEGEGEEEVPDTLRPQITALGELLDTLGLPRIGHAKYEADDVIASITAHGNAERVVITNDRDLVQVIDDERHVRLQMMVPGGMDAWPLLDEAAARERFGVEPRQYVDMAVLRGDPSDGLPGAPGIGAKTAVRLIQAFGDLDGVLRAAPDVTAPLTPRNAGTLCEHADALRAARTVATAVTTLNISSSAGARRPTRPRLLSKVAAEWGVESLVDELRAALDAHDNTSP